MLPPGRQAAEEAVRLAREMGQGKVWTKWVDKWLVGEVIPEKVRWGSDGPDHECLGGNTQEGWAGWHAWRAVLSEYIRGGSQYHLERVQRIAQMRGSG